MSAEPIQGDDLFLKSLRARVEEELAQYRYEVPVGCLGNPLPPSMAQRLLDEMRAALVPPYWTEVKLSDTFEHAKADAGPIRRCAVIADDGKGRLLVYDPIGKDFVLASCGEGRPTTFGGTGRLLHSA